MTYGYVAILAYQYDIIISEFHLVSGLLNIVGVLIIFLPTGCSKAIQGGNIFLFKRYALANSSVLSCIWRPIWDGIHRRQTLIPSLMSLLYTCLQTQAGYVDISILCYVLRS